MPKRIPRGIKNRNAFNIKINSRNNWLGKIPVSANTDGTFEQFETAVMGLRAGFLLILGHYSKRHDNTVAKLIRRWTETDQESYIATVANYASVDPDEKVNFRNWNLLKKVGQAMIFVENGNCPYKDYELYEGMMLAGVKRL